MCHFGISFRNSFGITVTLSLHDVPRPIEVMTPQNQHLPVGQTGTQISKLGPVVVY